MFSEGEPPIKTVEKYYDLCFENYAPLFWGKGETCTITNNPFC